MLKETWISQRKCCFNLQLINYLKKHGLVKGNVGLIYN